MVTETGSPCLHCSTSPTGKPGTLSEEVSTNAKEMREEVNEHGKDAISRGDSDGDGDGDGDDDVLRPRPRKERIKQSLAKLKKGPDGRFINVLEVASDLNLLIAAYQNLKAQERPTYLIEDSDDEDSMDGIDLERFKKLQRRLRTGTYKFGSAKEPKDKKISEEPGEGSSFDPHDSSL